MIINPTVTDLLTKVENRFELVIITSKRARQIVSGYYILTGSNEKSPITLASIEILQEKVNKVQM